METVTSNATRARREVVNDREYLVAKLNLIVPGVLNGSNGPLLYPPDEVAKNPGVWNGMPLVVYHPTDPETGKPTSARQPHVLAKSEVGRVFNTVADGKLTAEGWFDVKDTRRVDPRVLLALSRGQSIELSTGLFTENSPAPAGSVHNGRPYTHIARGYVPDHVAVLPDQRGACSIDDGCGVLVNEATENAFCPTGEGGGVDPSCSAGGKSVSHARAKGLVKAALAGEPVASVSELRKKLAKDLPGASFDKAMLRLHDEGHVQLFDDGASTRAQASGDYGGAIRDGGAAFGAVTLREPATKGAPKTAKPPTAKIAAPPDKVAALTARLAEAKAAVASIAAELKAAKADAAKVKSAVKAGATKKGATKADVLAKDTATKLTALAEGWLKTAKEAPKKKGDWHKDLSKLPTPAAMEAAITETFGKASAHKVAKELGLMTKFKNSAEAMVAIRARVVGKVGAYTRPEA